MTPSYNYALLFAVCLHIAFLGYLAVGKNVKAAPPKPQKVLVNTVRLQPKKAAEPIARAEKPKPPAPKPKPKPKPKPPAPKPKPKPPAPKPKPKPKPPAPKPKPKTQKPKPEKSSEKKLSSDQIAKLQEAKKALAKIDLKGPAKPEKTSAACDVVHLELDSADNRYATGLSKALKSLLTLPEYGAVKIKLTLARDGKVKKLEIINSESKVNEKNIEKALKNAKFSSFNNHFSGEDEHTFVIVLSNDI
jgi:type IV secretory pathway VirB10-like protein